MSLITCSDFSKRDMNSSRISILSVSKFNENKVTEISVFDMDSPTKKRLPIYYKNGSNVQIVKNSNLENLSKRKILNSSKNLIESPNKKIKNSCQNLKEFKVNEDSENCQLYGNKREKFCKRSPILVVHKCSHALKIRNNSITEKRNQQQRKISHKPKLLFKYYNSDNIKTRAVNLKKNTSDKFLNMKMNYLPRKQGVRRNCITPSSQRNQNVKRKSGVNPHKAINKIMEEIKIKILLKAYVKLKRVLQIRSKLTIVAKVCRTPTSTLFESKVRRILVETLQEGNRNGMQRESLSRAFVHPLRRSDNPDSVQDAIKRINHHQHILHLSMRINTSFVKNSCKSNIQKESVRLPPLGK